MENEIHVAANLSTTRNPIPHVTQITPNIVPKIQPGKFFRKFKITHCSYVSAK